MGTRHSRAPHVSRGPVELSANVLFVAVGFGVLRAGVEGLAFGRRLARRETVRLSSPNNGSAPPDPASAGEGPGGTAPAAADPVTVRCPSVMAGSSNTCSTGASPDLPVPDASDPPAPWCPPRRSRPLRPHLHCCGSDRRDAGTWRRVPGLWRSVLAAERILGHRLTFTRICSGLAHGIHGTVRTVVTLGVLTDFRSGGTSGSRPGVAIVGRHVAPGFLGLVSQGLGQAALTASRTVITFGVLAFLGLRVAAALDAGLAIAAFDVPASKLRFFWLLFPWPPDPRALRSRCGLS